MSYFSRINRKNQMVSLASTLVLLSLSSLSGPTVSAQTSEQSGETVPNIENQQTVDLENQETQAVPEEAVENPGASDAPQADTSAANNSEETSPDLTSEAVTEESSQTENVSSNQESDQATPETTEEATQAGPSSLEERVSQLLQQNQIEAPNQAEVEARAAAIAGRVRQLAEAQKNIKPEPLPYNQAETNAIVADTIQQPLQFEGPVPVTEENYSFSAMAHNIKPIDLAAHGYTEEEYFVSGTANVYQGDDQLQIVHEDIPYVNRIMVRKPSPEKFSGRVYIDILNASNKYDVEGLWYRTYRHLLDNNHAYVGVTSKPVVVEALQNFNPDRYGQLTWASNHTHDMVETPLSQAFGSIPGTEEGLVWDMLSQLGYQVKTNQADFLEAYPVEHVYLTGQSQSAMYLNTYANYFGEHVEDVYDGFLSTVGAGRMRTLNQQESLIPVKNQGVGNHQIPHIQVAAHGDVNLLRSDIDLLNALANDYEYVRLYEVASAPHSDPTSDIAPNNEDLAKAGRGPRKLLHEFDFEVSTLQLSYYVDTALELLHNWASQGIEPFPSLMLDRDANNQPLLDEHGNGIGGLQSPYLAVPIATYQANAVPLTDPPAVSMDTNGSMVYFTPEKLNELYKDKNDYLTQFKAAVDKQVAEGWLLPADADRMLQWSQDIANKLFADPVADPVSPAPASPVTEAPTSQAAEAPVTVGPASGQASQTDSKADVKVKPTKAGGNKVAEPSQVAKNQEKAGKSAKKQAADPKTASSTRSQAQASQKAKAQLPKTGSGFGVIGLALSSLMAGLGISRKKY